MSGGRYRPEAAEVEGGRFHFEVKGGPLHVSLHEDGSVRILSPKGPEIVTVWKFREALADDLEDHGLARDDALRTSARLDHLRPTVGN